MREIRKVGIIGMGALGLMYGSMITEGDPEAEVVYYMDRPRYERHKDEKNEVNGVEKTFTMKPSDEAASCDLIIVAVKYNSLPSALDTMAKAVGDDTIIISVMNGISTEKIIGKRFGVEKVLGCVALGMDAMHFPGKLIYTKSGKLALGTLTEGQEEKLSTLDAFLTKAGLAHEIHENILIEMWAKFMLNVGCNQTCMVFECGYGGMLKEGTIENMTAVAAMREVILLAGKKGIPISEKDLERYFHILSTLDPKATPSMGQDRINKNKSEVEMFAGEVMALAKEEGIRVPANAYLYKRVHEIEAEY